VKFPAFDLNMDFSFADFRGFNFNGLTSLMGKFRGANFSGLNFSGITFDVGSLDFTGADFSGSSNLGGLFSNMSSSVKRLFTGVSFKGVDFSGLSGLTTFKFGKFKGVDFSGSILTGLDFSGVDLSLSRFSFASVGGLKLGSANLTGIDLSGITGTLGSAAGAFFDALSKLPTSWDATFLKNLNEVVVEDIFAQGAQGPDFAFSGGLDFNNNEVDLHINLQTNLDRNFNADFNLSNADLPTSVADLLPTMSLSGSAYGRAIVALNLDFGATLGLRDQSVAGLFTVPAPALSTLDPYVKINRFDVGASLGVAGVEASLSVANLGAVTLNSAHIGAMVGGRLSLSDPNGDGKLSYSEIKALRDADSANWYKQLATVTPSAKFDAGFNVSVDSAVQVGGQSFSDVFGNPIIRLSSEQMFRLTDDGRIAFQAPDVFIDVALNSTHKTKLLEALDTLKEAGDSISNSEILTTELPGLGKSLSDLFVNKSGQDGFFKRLFALRTAADDYFTAHPIATTPATATSDNATIRGLIEALNESLRKAAAVPFDSNDTNWAGQSLAYTDFTGMNLQDFNFAGADLEGADFSGANLDGVNFGGANLSGAKFANSTTGAAARLNRATFTGAILKDVSLAGLDLRDANFSDTDLSGVDFTKASIIGALFEHAKASAATKLTGALYTQALATELSLATGFANALQIDPVSGTVNLAGYALGQFNLSELNLSHLNLTGANLAGANLRGAVLAGATLTNAVLSKAFIYKAQFDSALNVAADAVALADGVIGTSFAGKIKEAKSGTDLSGYDLSGLDLSGINFNGIDLSGADLAGAVFEGAKLAGATFSKDTDFTGADLSGLAAVVNPFDGEPLTSLPAELLGNFARTNLAGLDLSNISLKGLNLEGANLAEVTLNGATLELANLKGAVLVGLKAAGADLAAQTEALAAELTGAYYDQYTRFQADMAAALQEAMSPVAIDDVFERGASGPLFEFAGGLDVTGNEILIALNFKINLDKQVSYDFSLGKADLPEAARTLVPDFSLRGGCCRY
jgi:uncharacterized protein YjbI with pentapeptide repeats